MASTSNSTTPTSFKLTLKLGSNSTLPTPILPPILPTTQTPNRSYQQQPSTSNLNSHPSSSTPAITQNIEYNQQIIGTKSTGKRKEKRVKEIDDDSNNPSESFKALKKKFDALLEKQEATSIALFRTQKRLVRAREEKSSLLDRILLLESAAGLTSEEINLAQTQAESSLPEFPLLDPPPIISLKERNREVPIITTATDLTNSNYNQPLGPSPVSNSFPPRQRSTHLISAIAAQKLRDNSEARRIAKNLPKSKFPVISVLGLEGSTVAIAVEKALAGEVMVAPTPVVPITFSVVQSSKGKGKEVVRSQPINTLRDMPNPFNGAGAVSYTQPKPQFSPPPTKPTPLTQDARHFTDELVNSDNGMRPKPEFDDNMGSPMGSQVSFDDEGRGGDEGSGSAKKYRKLEGGERVKSKRLTGITSGTFSIQVIPRNEDGTPKLPLNVGIMVLNSIGSVDCREHFHTERYIFPVGYECIRKYPSMIHKTENAEYACRIIDGGDESPRFEISPSDQPGVIISGNTPTGAWSQIVKAANHLRERNHSNSVSGPDYYGLAQNVVKALIQELPRAREISSYVWQEFIEESISASSDSSKRKKSTGLPTKPVGNRRKFKDSNQTEDGQSPGIQLYNPKSFSRQGQPMSMSQNQFPSNNIDNFSSTNSIPSLSTLVHHQLPPPPQIKNPYDLPSGIDPSLSGLPRPTTLPPFFDPYAIPPPINNFTSPILPSDGGAVESRYQYTSNPYSGGNGGPPSFNSNMRRGSSSDGSL